MPPRPTRSSGRKRGRRETARLRRSRRKDSARLAGELLDLPLSAANRVLVVELIARTGDPEVASVLKERLAAEPAATVRNRIRSSLKRLTNGRNTDTVVVVSSNPREHGRIPKHGEHSPASPSVVGLDVETLRRRMAEAVADSGLSLAEIGQSMGIKDTKQAKNTVWYLMHQAKDPGIIQLTRFAQAVRMDVGQLLGIYTSKG